MTSVSLPATVVSVLTTTTESAPPLPFSATGSTGSSRSKGNLAAHDSVPLPLPKPLQYKIIRCCLPPLPSPSPPTTSTPIPTTTPVPTPAPIPPSAPISLLIRIPPTVPPSPSPPPSASPAPTASPSRVSKHVGVVCNGGDEWVTLDKSGELWLDRVQEEGTWGACC
ncbi:unnamed protein product [Closterium sp. NIES-53]